MEQLFRAVSDVLNGLGPNGATDEALAFVAWGRCAGEVLRKRTRPIEFFENRLIVAVEDKTWRRHLEELSPQMLVKLNALLGDGTIRFIEFRVDAPAVKRTLKTKAEPMENTDKIEPALATAADAISDDGLRQRFLDAAASCLGAGKQG